MKEQFIKKFNELDDLTKTVFITETPDFKSLKIFADSLKPNHKSLLLNIISMRNVTVHSKTALFSINQEAVDAIEGFIEGLKRSIQYDLNYEINPLIEKQKTSYIHIIHDWIESLVKNKHNFSSVELKKHQGYIYDCLREVIQACTYEDLSLYFSEAKRYFESLNVK